MNSAEKYLEKPGQDAYCLAEGKRPSGMFNTTGLMQSRPSTNMVVRRNSHNPLIHSLTDMQFPNQPALTQLIEITQAQNGLRCARQG